MFNNSSSSFLFNLVKDKPLYTIAGYIFSFSSAISNVSAIALLIPILFFLFNEPANFVYSDFSYCVEQLLILCTLLDDNYRLNILVFFLLLTSLASIVFAYLSSFINVKHNKHLVYEMRCLGFNLLSKANLNYYRRHQIGDILFKINREIDKAVLAIKSSQKIITISVTFAIFSLALILISLKLTIVTIAAVGLSYVVNSFLGYRAKKQESLLSQKLKIYNRQTIEFLTGIDYIKNTANELEEYQSIVKSIEAKNNAELNTWAVSSAIEPINKILATVIIITVSMSCYYLYDKQTSAFLAILLVYTLILFKLIPLVGKLNNARYQFASNKPSIEIVNSFFKEINKPAIKSGTAIFRQLKHKVELHNVTFAYPHHAQIVLDKIDLSIDKGSTIALVGSSGSGKSTLVSLLSRLYEPIEGKITIDGRDISEYDLRSLRKAIAIVNKEAFLFNNSILYNLTYGLNNISRERVIAATKITKISNFITKLPQGFDSNLNNPEIIFSEAQKQLIAITRALLSEPKIVVLDEPMKNISKLDRETVQNALDELCRDRTTIEITNRLSAIEKADKIVVLNKGRIIESGTHKELLKNGNLYKKMCSTQFKTSQQSRQQLLAKKISKKLSRQTNDVFSSEIRNNLSSLLNYLQLINEGLVNDDREKILDESYQSAKNMLASLREYQQRISRGLNNS